MRYEKIEDPIEVIVHFATGAVKPIRFLWRGRAHKVTHVRGKWISTDGQRRRYHWAVKADGVGACELELDMEKMAWKIREVAVE